MLLLSLLVLVSSLQASTNDDVSSCVGCHWAIFEEWEASRHAVSWANPIFQKNLESTPNQDSCARCHSPTRILAKGPTSIPSPRSEDRDTGVNCITCHADPEGVMHGPFGAVSTGHETAQNLLFAADKAEALCLTCHGQPTVRDHSIRHSYFFRSGSLQEKNCIECHMPEVTRRQAEGPLIKSCAPFRRLPLLYVSLCYHEFCTAIQGRIESTSHRLMRRDLCARYKDGSRKTDSTHLWFRHFLASPFAGRLSGSNNPEKAGRAILRVRVSR